MRRAFDPRLPLRLSLFNGPLHGLLIGLAGLAGCSIDNGLSAGEKPPGRGEDTGEPDEETPGDTDEVASCPDQSFAGTATTLDESCASEPVVGTFTPVIKWRNNAVGDTYTSPVVGRIYDENGDGLVDENDMPAVVVATTGGQLVALAGDTGAELWRAGSMGSEPMTAALADVTGDGRPEVIGSGVSQTLAVRGNGETVWSVAGVSNAYCGAVGAADLDGDGQVEILLGSVILNGSDGSLRGRGSYGSGTGFSGGWAAAMGVAADIDGDGIQEAVVGNALYDASGNAIWYNGQSDGFVAVANFDADPQGEIVVSNVGTIRLQDDDGTVLWSGSYTGSTSGPPTVADFDGNGTPDIGVAGSGVYIVLNSAGSVLWSRATVDYSSGFTGSAVFDFEGDGAAEVVYADENNLFVFDGATGATKLEESEHSSATCSEYPTIADVDNDGHAEIIYTSSAYSGSEQGVRVVGDADNTWMSGRPVWNEHAYSITNVNDDVTIPGTPEQNWEAGYNNFRSGDITPVSGSGLPDLTGRIMDVCADNCAAGDVTVWIAVANNGTSDISTPFLVELLADVGGTPTVIHSQTWTETVPSGWLSDAVELNLTGLSTPVSQLRLRVNGDGAITECHSDNNDDVWGDTVCP